jgi:hypothetical protein
VLVQEKKDMLRLAGATLVEVFAHKHQCKRMFCDFSMCLG